MRNNFVFDVNEELNKIRGHIPKEISRISKISSPSPSNLNFSNKDKRKNEVMQLIKSYAKYWKETEKLIDDYIQDQLISYSLDDLISCFRSLHADIQIYNHLPAKVANLANHFRG